MTWLYLQSIVQYRVDPDTGDVEITKKFTCPIRGAQNKVRKKRKKTLKSEQGKEVYLT